MLKIVRPEWEVGDTIYFQRNGSQWYKRAVIGVTAQSYIVLPMGQWELYKDRKIPEYIKESALKFPKSLKKGDDTYVIGTEVEYERFLWAAHHRTKILQALDWATRWGKEDVLYGLACVLGLEEATKAYPFPEIISPEAKHEKQSAGNSSGNKTADANGPSQT